MRLCEAVGGVFDSGGEMSVGVATPSSGTVSVDCSTASCRAMLLNARRVVLVGDAPVGGSDERAKGWKKRQSRVSGVAW